MTLLLLLALWAGAAAPTKGVAVARPANPLLDGPYSKVSTARAESSLRAAGAPLPTAEGLKAKLAPLELVRVEAPSGPGNGHQAAAATTMRRLRELGFEGRFEVVYSGASTREKLDMMLPGFRPVLPDGQQGFGGEKISVRPASSREPAPLIVSASGLPELGMRGAAIAVEPYAWAPPSYFDANGWHVEDSLFGYLLPYRASTRLGDSSWEGSDRLRAKRAGLEVLDARLGEVELLPVYGMSNMPRPLVELLHAVSRARDLAPGVLRGAVAVPFFSHIEEPIFRGFLRKLSAAGVAGDVVVAAITDADAVSRALDQRGKTVLIRTGGVSQSAFESFYARQTLPGTVAGANAQNLMRVLGLPYLNTVPRHDHGQIEVLPRMSPQDRALTMYAGQQLVGESHGDFLPRFLLAAKNRASGIAKAFEDAKPVELRHDKLAMLLAAALR